uniref:DNA-directed RNA polymerase I subunit RPA34 n=1 Tax=Pelusios castaneus TaxID=367368 RepID=A0A8C8SS57_9SAUR
MERLREAPEGLPRFQCPPDFCPSPFAPGPSFLPEQLRDPSKELWLIRAPADFSPESLDGRAMPLVGFQTLKTKAGGTRRVFDVHSALREPGSPHLLVPLARSGQLSCASSFHGCMNICERFGDRTRGSPPKAIAARPAPQIMVGLKQRFLPFGGSPKRRCPEEAAMSPPATDMQGELGPARKKKKKRAKEEPKELPVSIKQEPVEEPWSWESGDPAPEAPRGEGDDLRGAEEPTVGDLSHRHKKKKKKHRHEALDREAWPGQLLDHGSIKQEPAHLKSE